jgi:hypothetical protein
VEAVDRRTEDGSTARLEQRPKLVGEGRLPRSVHAVDRNPDHVRSADGGDEGGEPVENGLSLAVRGFRLATLRRPRGSTRVAKGDGL